jgi:hypothetical protein
VKKIRAHLTVANVLAWVALFTALGGVGYAATKLPRDSVGAKQLKNGAVTGAKLKAKAVTATKLGAGAVGTAALADGAVTGAKLNAATLGTVPSANHANSAAVAGDATTLGGRPPGAFVQGDGRILGNTVQLGRGDQEVPVLDVPGFGPLTASCETGGKGGPVGSFKLVNATGADLSTSLQYPEGSDGAVIPPGKFSGVGGFEVVAAWTWTFTTLTSPARIVTLNLGFDGNDTPTACILTAQAVISG